MTSQFWRFGNANDQNSPINLLLENAFIENDYRSTTSSPASKGSKARSFGFNSYTDDENDDQEDDHDHDQRDDYTVPNLSLLPQVLDDEDCLSELLASNIKLVQYLRSQDVLIQLVKYIITCDDYTQFTNDPSDIPPLPSVKKDTPADVEHPLHPSEMTAEDMENEETQVETPQAAHSRRASVCTDILSADTWSLADTFMDNADLLPLLWSVLDAEAPLSISLSAHFMKVNEHLLDSKTDEMLYFLLHQTNIVDRFLRHVDNPALVDFLLKVISTDKPDNSSGIIDLLKEQDLINKLIAFLRPEVNASIQSAAGDLLKAIITISANSNADNSTIGPNELTRDLVSEVVMEELSDLMLQGGTSLSNGVGIIIEIIRKNNSDYDLIPVLCSTIEMHPPNSRDPIYLGHLIKVFSKKIPQFTAMLEHSNRPTLETPFGSIEPLGFERFKICELIAELLHCSNMGLLNDEAGEAIVHERDVERARVLELMKQKMIRDEQRFHTYDFSLIEEDDDVSRDINRLSISSDSGSDSFQETSETPRSDDITQEDIDIALESTEHDDSTDRATLKDQEEGEQSQDVEDVAAKPNNALESEPDSDPEGSNGELEFDENEPILRKQAIVGDQLKIALIDNKVIIKILQMFFHFPWNNFLHNVVFDIVQQILNGSMEVGYNRYLAIDLFGRGEITKLIIEGHKKCEDHEAETGLRLGYMGHLTLIAEEVVKFLTVYPPGSIHEIIVAAVSTEEWAIYHNETLVETREKYNALLGGDPEGEEDDEGEEEDGEEDDEEEEDEEHTGPVGLRLDPNVDHDITGSGYQEHDGPEDETEMSDKFSRYMSQHINNDIPNKSSDEDEEEDDDDDDDEDGPYHDQQQHLQHMSSWGNQQYQMAHYEDDDYEDPNDDGQSYTRKSHPLYNEMLSLNNTANEHSQGNMAASEEALDESSSSSSSEDDDDEDREEKEGENNDEKSNDGSDDSALSAGYTLTRNKSKGEMNWDDEEQDRLINMANYIKTHGSNPNSSSPAPAPAPAPASSGD